MMPKFEIIFKAKVGKNIWTWEKNFYCPEEDLERVIDFYLNRHEWEFWTKEDITWKK